MAHSNSETAGSRRQKNLQNNSRRPDGRRKQRRGVGFEIDFDSRKLTLLVLILDVLIAVLAVFAVFQFIIGISRVSGKSMMPTLKNGQTVVYERLITKPKIGDIVTIRTAAGDHYIKRVVAGPGDTVEIRNNALYVNGKISSSEEFAKGDTRPASGRVSYPYKLKEDMYFLLGDNRQESVDSRTFGPVSSVQITGIIIGK